MGTSGSHDAPEQEPRPASRRPGSPCAKSPVEEAREPPSPARSDDVEVISELERTFETLGISEVSSETAGSDRPRGIAVDVIPWRVPNSCKAIARANSEPHSSYPHAKDHSSSALPSLETSMKSAPNSFGTQYNRDASQSPDTWIYHKKRLNDFDPDKFREANKKIPENE